MKRLILIDGPMGVGKTAVGQCLKRRLDTVRVDTTALSAEAAADIISRL